ncbi:MAG TPA: BatA domain-containing protein [Planctomycetota bacterium]|nr:BatA domain-containing protein [Planctomycetota bacterium]
MEFWHAAFLAGTATFTIPVVIHLIFRMRKRRVVFSSLRFLQQSVLKESKRLKLRELILLLLRCLACILIALAFARPFRPDSALALGSGRPQEDAVIVLDDSPSLMAQEDAAIRFPQLLEKARKQVGTYRAGDRVGLVLASDPARAEIELSGNFGAVAAALQREKTSARRGDLAQALNTALDLLGGSTQFVRKIYVFSDLQSNQVDRGAWAEIAQKAAAAGRGIAVQIETPSGSQPKRLPNLSITDVRPKSDVWIEGRPVPFAIRVANHGDSEQPSVQVKLNVDGKTIATRNVGLGPRSSTEIELSAPLPRAGEVAGDVEIAGRDAFPEDDKRLFALRLRDSLKVLVVEERLGDKDSFLDEGYYIRMALDPKARGGEQPTSGGGLQNYIQVQAVEVSKVTAEMYRGADLIVLAGIQALNPGELTLLEEAVRDGHNLILFTGRSDGRLSEAFYNGPFWKNGKGLLPARPGPLYEGNRAEGKYHQLGEFKADHILFKPFAGPNEPNLRLPRYVKHFQASPVDLKIGSDIAPQTPPANGGGSNEKPDKAEKEKEKDKADDKLPLRPPGEVLATFGDGTPFVMERPYSKGNVLMFTFVPRPEATDLPKRKAFVPLLHQAVRHFAGVSTTSRRNLIVGDNFDFADAGATPEAQIALEKPGVAKEVLNLTGKDHPVAEAAGLYTAAFQKGNIRERSLWAVNLDPRESDLNSEDLASIRNVFASNSLDAKAGSAASGIRQWDDEQKSQAPDWRYFLVAALAILLLEVWLRDFWA